MIRASGDRPLLADVDVCIVGAGSAGSTAAIAAARAGASVLLIDRLPFLGGTSTAVLDTFYGFHTPGAKARKVVGGINYLAEHLKVVWEDLVARAGARILLLASVRSMAQCMAMGQAAGKAAALAVRSRQDPRDIDLVALRDRLRADGAILDLADEPEVEGDARARRAGARAATDEIEAPATR